MSKKKILTPQERKKQEIAQHLEAWYAPKGIEKSFIKISHYMLQHKKYKELSSSAKVALSYMLDWATHSNEFWQTGTFEYSYSMLVNNGIMARQTAVTSLKELREKGFINIELRDGAGATNKWSFGNWYRGY